MRSTRWALSRIVALFVGVCVVVAWQQSSAGEASETTSERVTRVGSMMPLQEPSPPEFALEADNAPYAVIDSNVSEDLSQVHDTQIFVFNGKLGIAYSDGIPNRQVKLWYDDGSGGGTAGDALANGSEIRVVDSLQLFFIFDSAAVSAREVNGLLAVTYSSESPSFQTTDLPDALKLWYDDGRGGGIAGDVVVNGGEVRTLAAAFERGGEIMERNGQLLVLWREALLLRLWADDGAGGGTAGDGLVNGTEVRTLNVGANPEIGHGPTMTNVGGDLAVAYWQNTPFPFATLRVWVDDGAGGGIAGDLLVNGLEDHTLPFFERPPTWWSGAAWVAGKLAISFQVGGTTGDLFFWYDDGGTAGDGVAGDLAASPTETRQLLHEGDVGAFSGIAELNGRIAVTNQFVLPPQLKMFYDDGNDGTVADDAAAFGGTLDEDSAEARGIDQPLGGGGFGASVTVFNPDPGDPSVCDQLAVAHINQCDTACGYPDDLALHLTLLNAQAPRGQFIHDTGNHDVHDPVALTTDIDLTLRWFQDGADEGEIFISGDVSGPNVGVWLTMVENLFAFPDYMTVPVDLVPGDGEKTIFMSFRTGVCAGTSTVRTLTLGVAIPDPTNLAVTTGAVNDVVMDWDDVTDPALDGYNVYRATTLPAAWTLLTGTPLPAGTSTYTDTPAVLGSGGIYYYYVTALDSLGNESSDPPE